MAFWVRFFALILLCIVAPLGLGFYLDTQSEVRRATDAGAAAAEAALPALRSQLTLHGYALVNKALGAAQELAEERLVPSAKVPIRVESFAKMVTVLDTLADKEGFAWLVDETGAIVARNGQSEREESPEKITGHPLFVSTQDGFALDGFWKSGDKLFFLGIAPLVRDGDAKGAVFVGQLVGPAMVADLAKEVGAEVSVILSKELVASTLPSDIVASIQAKLGPESSSVPVNAGRLPDRLGGGQFPFLPLFVDHHAEDLAFTSLAHEAPGRNGVTWVLSARSAENLRLLAERQQGVLGVMLSATLLALMIGLMLFRSYARPIKKLVEHLSEITHGRGERELPEAAVPGPFRRLVKLVNMTVQRIPTSTFGGYPDEGPGGRPTLNMPEPASVSGDLGMAMIPSMPPASIAAPSFGDLNPLDLAPEPGASRRPSPLAPAYVPPRPPVEPSIPIPAALAQNGPQADAELAAAINALEGQVDRGASRRVRSASEIRGGVPGAGLANFPGTPEPRRTGSFRAVPVDPLASSSNAVPIPGRTRAPVPAPPEPSHDQLLAYLDELKEHDSPKVSDAPFGGGSHTGGVSRMGGSALGDAAMPDVPDVPDDGSSDGFRSENTVVAAPNEQLLRDSATDGGSSFRMDSPNDRTVVADVPEHLLAESKLDELDPVETAHFKETYERFIDMRRHCREPTADLAFDRFVAKLRKNREGLIKKYNCRTVRFQVYEKDGKAALKATPVKGG